MIIQLSGSDQFPRIKIGVGQKPHADYDLADWVLSAFSAEEIKTLQESHETVAKGIERILAGDIEGAMQLCNGK